MAAGRFSEKCKVIVSSDNMSAKLFIEPPSDGIAYSIEELTEFVKNKGVYGGIMYSALEMMSQNNIYYEEYEIAKGILPKDGVDGYYEIFFNNDKIKKPLIRSDGSVDYQSMNMIISVRAGELLAVYHPAIKGDHGIDVRGRTLRSKPVKEFPKLVGTGFNYIEDTHEYISAVEGRVEYEQNKLNIRSVYEHRGDLDLIVGKIDFRGDVIVHGNVLSGTYIRASKSITIEGSVESATLIAEGDIVIKKGMQGGQKARISCGGDLYANFIEFTQVECKGKVEANIVMNCQISAGKDIVISGKKGAIVGGSSYAVGTINCTFMGNVAGHRTVAAVGVTKELNDRNRVLNLKLISAEKGLKNTETEIVKTEDIRISNLKKEVRQAKLAQLRRKKARDLRIVQHIKEELELIQETMSVGEKAKIIVNNTTFPSCVIMVDEQELDVERSIKKAEFVRGKEGNVKVIQ